MYSKVERQKRFSKILYGKEFERLNEIYAKTNNMSKLMIASFSEILGRPILRLQLYNFGSFVSVYPLNHITLP